MICSPCTEGDHCGGPGQKTLSCTCQHHPAGTRQPQKTGRMECPPVPTTFTPKAYADRSKK